MRRRRFMVLGGTVLLAGCGGDGGNGDGNGDGADPSPTPDETDADGDDSGNGDGTETPTPDGVENQTGEDRNVGGSGNFQPTVTFNSCTKVTVEADEAYQAVAVGLVDGTNDMHNDGYEGSNTFEADQTIDEVLVWSESGDKSNKVNPNVDSCPGPE